MDKFWLNKARKYITGHNAFNDVSEILEANSGKKAIITATVSVNLPSKFIKADIGVKDKEDVEFVFHDSFPLKAPNIYLRDDFPKSFPHINPSLDHVKPCIYEGDLSELLQQSEWMFGILKGIKGLKDQIAKIDLDNIDENKLFIVLSVKRPVNISGTDSDIEFLNFVIYKSKHRLKKGRELKRTLSECKVGMLSHVSERSPALLKRISGTNTKLNKKKNIALVGCGSLGSKIGIHLARNGNGPFLCIDDDIFMPHNNTRHALTMAWAQNKAELVAYSIMSIGLIYAKADNGNVFDTDFGTSRVIIDTTASFSVRNFLMSRKDLPPIISCGLYNNGRCGLLVAENKDANTRLTEIWGYLYYMALDDAEIQRTLFSSELENVRIGQSCSSQTLAIDDARISLMASAMSMKIQNSLETNLADNAEVMFLNYDGDYSLNSQIFPVPDFIEIQSKKEWRTYISRPVINQMKELMQSKVPNEIGGALLGSVFLYLKTIVITDIIFVVYDAR